MVIIWSPAVAELDDSALQLWHFLYSMAKQLDVHWASAPFHLFLTFKFHQEHFSSVHTHNLIIPPCNLRKILLCNYYISAQCSRIGGGESKVDSVDQKGEKIQWWKNAGMKLEVNYGSCIILTWICFGLSWDFLTASPIPWSFQFKYFLGQFSSGVFNLELDEHEFLSIARACCLWKTGYLCSPCIPCSLWETTQGET